MFRQLFKLVYSLFLRKNPEEDYLSQHQVIDGSHGHRINGDVYDVEGVKYSKRGMIEIINHEVGSPAYYRKKYHRPTWPKGYSGVTIGIGYDLGHVTLEQLLADWGDKSSVGGVEIDLLKNALSLKGSQAKNYTAKIKNKVSISFEDALEVFYNRTVPKYHRITMRAFPGMEKLPPVVCSVLLSLVYNRGGSMGKQGSSSWNRRREMREIRDAVKAQNLHAIAQSLKSMKRLWVGKGQDGLLKRRDREAELVLSVA